MGVHTRYVDGLGRHVRVAPETMVRVCAALGAPVTGPADAAEALQSHRATRAAGRLPPVMVAWEGALPSVPLPDLTLGAELRLETGELVPLDISEGTVRGSHTLPHGYHSLTIEGPGRSDTCTVIAAPVQAYRRPGQFRSWGIGTQLAALRSARSRSVGDLRDLETVCRWVGEHGGDLVTVLPLLPTFNTRSAEPSPYSPVSRLFWSELMLDLGAGHRPTPIPETLDVTSADAEVRTALASHPLPDLALLDEEVVRYARFRGVQARLGPNWREWPPPARQGSPAPDLVDPAEERFQLIAQDLLRRQLHGLRQRLDRDGMRLGLDLAVGVHPDGYDPWSRQTLFADGMSVGAPPDLGFPSGQDWGFRPVHPYASRAQGHRYLARSIAHQMELAGVLRVDHIMAWTRLYWIPHGLGLHQGTYVSYPAEDLFAILTLESERHGCELIGENLGTVPRAIHAALPRHRIWGMYVAQFQAAGDDPVAPPTSADVALIGTHDTPTLAGWMSATDVADRVRHGLLAPEAEERVRAERARAVARLAERLGCPTYDPAELLGALLEWLGRSESPLVIPWLEDLWLEDRGVNLPGTRSSEQPNWQRPMRYLLEQIFADPRSDHLVRRLDRARHPE